MRVGKGDRGEEGKGDREIEERRKEMRKGKKGVNILAITHIPAHHLQSPPPHTVEKAKGK